MRELRIINEMPRNVRNFLRTSKMVKPLYVYLRSGIYFNYGPFTGESLTKLYRENDEFVLQYLENILDSDEAPYKIKLDTIEVIKDLKNNYPSYEL